MYREFDARGLSKMKRSITSESDDSDIHSKDIKEVDKLSLRPMEANIRVNLFSIKAELTKVNVYGHSLYIIRLVFVLFPPCFAVLEVN